MPNYRVSLVPALALALLLGPTCREDLPTPDYSDQIGIEERIDAGTPEGFLAGTDPLQEGEQRLNIGLAYEGRFTREISVGTGIRNVFAFDLNGDGTGDFTITGGNSFDRVEGVVATEIVHAGFGFWGLGVFYRAQVDSSGTRGGSVDLSGWRVMHMALKSSDEAFEVIRIGMESGQFENNFAARVEATDYGYVNDGEWHVVDIPLADFEAQGVILQDCSAPLIFSGDSGRPGEVLLIDEVYFTD